MRPLYEHGQPFSQVLEANLKDVISLVENKEAGCIVIDGKLGRGKTTLAVHCADYINEQKNLPPIKYDEQLGLGGAQFQSRLRLCYEKKLPVCIYDEAGDFDKRGALGKFNKMMNRTFQTYRAYRIVVIVVLPCGDDLDTRFYKNGIPSLILNCSQKHKTHADFRLYSVWRYHYVLDKMHKIKVPLQAYGMVEPNARGHFKDLEAQRAQELDIIGTGEKLSLLRTSETETSGLYNYKQISEQTGRSTKRISNIANKLKIKPAKILDRQKYFNKQQTTKIKDYIENQTGNPWKRK